MRITGILVLVFVFNILQSQTSTQIVHKDDTSYVFGQIFTDFRYAFKDSQKPQAAFGFSQGVIGFSHRITDKLRGLIIYDVTRTTHFYDIIDTAGNPLNYSYFEGSKYTAFLKMAEIKWDLNDMFTLRVGQLLNTQYLTFQDRFWGYRYIDFTYQEKYRLGNPADFGAQIDFKYKDKFVNQLSVVNGEGPFRYQDNEGKFLYSNNFQYYPTENLTLKLYIDYSPSPDTGQDRESKSVWSGFVGYKADRFRIGGEYTYIYNYGYFEGRDYFGYSVYGSAVLNQYFQVLARYDHLTLKLPELNETLNYYLIGFQYEPITKLTTSINFRYYTVGYIPFVYVNFGLKF